ncbi:DUF2325 domain-containing protein [Thauera butanivorans]|uniref:DUF2325 domain-containing protein n=1 Tax=Thauera butanivorans TaxID=86174 RepID=UPI00083933D9|nr:DUF2325 domain-containing protein [Thauera butanivorans]
MEYASHDFDQLAQEHRALIHDYGRAQRRCTEQLHAQARELERLRMKVMHLQAEVIMRETALAWEREDRATLEAAIPGLSKRVTLARHVETLVARIQMLMRERLQRERPRGRVPGQWGGGEGDGAPTVAVVGESPASGAVLQAADPEALEASLRAADLVICQTGCLSHGDYWRVQDYCKRTNKTCVFVEQAGVPDSAGAQKIGAGELRVLSLAGDVPGRRT